MSLRDTQKHLLEELKEHLAVVAAGAPAGEIGAEYDAAEECFHALACCKLLLAGDAPGFQRYLFWAGLARRYFLRRCQVEKTSDFRCARSRSEGLFCAAAAGDLPLAVEIGDLSPAQPVADGEYPEDFAYHLYLHRRLAGAPAADRADALRMLEQASGGPSPRVEVCKALEAQDLAAFEAALESLATAWAAEQDALRPQSADLPAFEPLSRLFTEGLALIRVAEHAGLAVPRRDFPSCPRSARVKAPARRPDDLFADLANLPP